MEWGVRSGREQGGEQGGEFCVGSGGSIRYIMSPGIRKKQGALHPHLYALAKFLIGKKGAGLWFNRFIMGLISLNVVSWMVFTMPEVVPDKDEPGVYFDVLEIGSALIFTIEYIMLLISAQCNKTYGCRTINFVKSPTGILDLVSILPFWLYLFYGVALSVFCVWSIENQSVQRSGTSERHRGAGDIGVPSECHRSDIGVTSERHLEWQSCVVLELWRQTQDGQEGPVLCRSGATPERHRSDIGVTSE